MDRQAARNRIYSYGARKIGAFALLVGAFLLYLCVYQPLQDAENGASTVTGMSGKGTMAGVVAALFGVALLIGGEPVKQFLNPPPDKSKVPSVIVSIVLVSAGFGVYYLVKSHVESLGYVFKF